MARRTQLVEHIVCTYKYSFVPRSKQTAVHYKDTLISCTTNSTQHINRLYGQRAKMPNVKTRGTRGNH
jgi:hypothetical protein